jgi:hypothetical protein
VPILVTAQPLDTSLDLITNNSAVCSVANWDLFLQANNFEDWTKELTAGQLYTIPDDLEVNINNLADIQANPVSLPFTSQNYSDAQTIFTTLNDLWILSDGTWNEINTWKAQGIWKTT